MVTTHVSCSYYRELSAFDEILIRMSVGSMSPSRLRMLFRYFLVLSGDEELPVAEGEQEVVCVQRVGSTLEPVLLPVPLREALQRYVDSTPVGVEVTMARY
jgi:enediyne biosynthesis thioesterase